MALSEDIEDTIGDNDAPIKCSICPANGNICEHGPDECCDQFWENLLKHNITKELKS